MKLFGAVLAAIGLIIAAYFGLLFDTRKSVGGSIGGASLEIKIADEDREKQRSTGLMLGLGAIAGGGVLMALAGKRR